MNGRSLLIISNLVTISVTAVAVLFALHNQHSIPGTSSIPFLGGKEQYGRDLMEDDCCDCTTGGPIDPPINPPPPSFCFTADSTVQVLQYENSVKVVSMKDIQIGDSVRASNGKYERVYSFGHYSPTVWGDDYVELSVGPNQKLTLSPDHMVWTTNKNGEGMFVAASQVQVGDDLLWNNEEAFTVQEIQQGVTAQGLLAPFTPSGTIVVDGFLASTFIDSVKDQNIPPFLGSSQWIAHSFEFPHRLACHYNVFGGAFCATETYTEEGLSNWVAAPFELGQWVLKQNDMIRYGLLTLFGLLLALGNVVEFACLQYPIVAVGLLGGYYYNHRAAARKL
mmetsp:Transcript_8841/g.14704  ORF Transcript_8841/g.14704 Transcript_8841/m.14704 type:complete len:336 (+) Transcript_8841:128-1135(+)|eukprot:CAMPEP_0119014324 /NCGR_PEP_ID=MMETSP1176-20130426/9504_1 /TAXON_ID=265551 /ORGANISM="Synedropsis recta cf, Strain CCMP1620" /LENGTH=335 /DNA_ID=CAMNT_0006967479 /DNA_START=127 /DNA_END=1134 /DNA_ORIENTATION=+